IAFEDFSKTLSNRLTFDDHLRVNFNDKLHNRFDTAGNKVADYTITTSQLKPGIFASKQK
ncbi:hypothetical protein, partial [Bacillus cereus group sp. Bce037]|uniref:hypothetical protein n=1 Tax=Bacillus cereus group sp. Bce037 TaxID=3445232 RepID=UPI003F695A71